MTKMIIYNGRDMEVLQTLPKLILTGIPHAKHSGSTELHRALQVSENKFRNGIAFQRL